MPDPYRFTALNTKIRALKKSVLQESDYVNMMKLDSTQEIAHYLNDSTIYRSILNDYNIKDLHRRDLEYLVHNFSISRWNGLVHFLAFEYRELFKALLFYYEVCNVNIILRGIGRNRPREDTRRKINRVHAYLDVDYDKLLSLNSIDEFINQFKNTVIEEPLYNVTLDDVRTKEFHIEMNLDYVYFSNLFQTIEKIPKEDRKCAQKIIGIFVDLNNFQWIYRGKVHFSLTDEEVLNYTLRGGLKFSFHKMKDIIYSNNFKEEFFKTLEDKYPGMFKSNYMLNPRKMQQYYMGVLQKESQKNPHGIAPLFEFFRIMEYEYYNIITMIESTKYKPKNPWDYIIPTFGRVREEVINGN